MGRFAQLGRVQAGESQARALNARTCGCESASGQELHTFRSRQSGELINIDPVLETYPDGEPTVGQVKLDVGSKVLSQQPGHHRPALRVNAQDSAGMTMNLASVDEFSDS